MIKVVHFSQDFQKNKAQLGGFNRIYNLCSDGNEHFIFTISKTDDCIKTWNLTDRIFVISIPVFTTEFKTKDQIFKYKTIAKSIKSWLNSESIIPDILFGHSHLINFYILRILKLSYTSNIPLIWELNVIWSIHNSKSYFQKILLFIIKLIQKDILNKADRVIAQTYSSKDYVVRFLNADSNKISVITNAVSGNDILLNPNYDINFVSNSFLCIGLFDTMNGIPFLLDIIDQNTDFHSIHFFGNGFHLNSIKSLASRNYCYYGGSISRNEMMIKFLSYEFLIIPRLPLLEADLFIPTKLLDAMSRGVIPICSDVEGIKEVINNGYNGFLFKAGNKDSFISVFNKLKTLSKEEKYRIRLNAIETINSKYQLDHQLKLLQKVYNK